MGKVTVLNHVTLDGVMQAPARPDEDTRDGFTQGGWAMAGGLDAGAPEDTDEQFGGALLFGRRTYEDFYAIWPNQPQPNPFTEVLNASRKYVASRTLEEPLPWENSTLLDGDAADAVARLKQAPGNDLLVMGSGDLIQSLMRRGLIDEFVLMVHPLVLGSGRRLFTDGGAPADLTLVATRTTDSGVVVATYRRTAS
ncbi:MAG: dihydrofolate reductase family protein [Chloroflexota bacterium]|nr:dihydrofolate reductase family protein [Chloroflexota bacterium]